MQSPVPQAGPQVQRSLSNSTIKGTLQKTPPRMRAPHQHQMRLDPTGVEGSAPPTHRAGDARGPSDQVQTMSKSKRVEPCGRCQVMTAVRVALPCGRLVNLCIPCASTFARFLSRRIRDLARKTLSDNASTEHVHGDGVAATQRQDVTSKETAASAKGKLVNGKISLGHDTFGRNVPSPFDMANEHLEDRALDSQAASKILGRTGKGQIPDNAGGGLSPTFRAKASQSSRKLLRTKMSREVPFSLPTGASASPMIVSDTNSPSPFTTPASRSRSQSRQDHEWQWEGHVRSDVSRTFKHPGLRNSDSASGTSPCSKLRHDGSERQRGRSLDENSIRALSDGNERGEMRHEHKQAIMVANRAQGRERDRENELYQLPHGKHVSQTFLSENKQAPQQSFFPDLKGARPDTSSPKNVRAGDHLYSSISPAHTRPQQTNSKDSAVWRERGAAAREQAHIDGAVAALDRFDYKMNPTTSRRHAGLMDTAKEIRQRIIEDLHGSGGKSRLGCWSNGSKKIGPTAVPLALNTGSGANDHQHGHSLMPK